MSGVVVLTYDGECGHTWDLTYLGRIMSNHSISRAEACSLLGIGDIDGDIALLTVANWEELDGMAAGEEIGIRYMTFQTAEGPRFIRIPWVPGVDLWEIVAFAYSDLYYALDGDKVLDISSNVPNCPEWDGNTEAVE